MSDRPTPSRSDGTGGAEPSDPVLARRARADRLASAAQRTGYLSFGAALGVFFVGIVVGLDTALVTIILVCLGVGSVFLLPGILLGYAVKAARREEAEGAARRAARDDGGRTSPGGAS